jgi:hypothetical protein
MTMLYGLIRKLLSTLPYGTKDGPLQHILWILADTDKGPYYTCAVCKDTQM